MNTPHKHADILRALADGKKVELLTPQGAWKETGLTQVANYPATTFRIAPETITVNGVECPKPLEQNIHTGNWVSIETNGHLFEISFAKAADAKTVFDALCKPFITKELT